MGKRELPDAIRREGNVVEWIDVAKDARILLVTVSKEGDIRDREDEDEAAFLLAVQKIFAGRGAFVTTVCADELQSLWDDKLFDMIFLNGVLTQQKQKHMSETKVLSLLARHLLPDGRLITVEHNRIGAAYLSGHPAKKNRGIAAPKMDLSGSGYTRCELLRLLRESGFMKVNIYYPYEDAYAARAIYTDAWQPDVRERYYCREEREKIELFDEAGFGEILVEEGVFAPFSNAFVAEAYVAAPSKQPPALLYAKYTDGRRDEYALRTSIYAYPSGEKAVTKTPLCKDAFRHVSLIHTIYEKLVAYYKGYSLQIVPCVKMEDGVGFSFLKGKKLTDVLNELLAAGDLVPAARLMQRFTDVVMSPAKLSILDKKREAVRFGDHEGFVSMFGSLTDYEEDCLHGEEYLNLTDADLNFDSIMVDGQTWTMYDYEWVVDFPVPFSYVLWRAIDRYYYGPNAKLASGDPEDFWLHFKLDGNKRSIFTRMARSFDRYIGKMERTKSEGEEHVYTLDELLDNLPKGGRVSGIPIRTTYADGEVERMLVLPRREELQDKVYSVYQLQLSPGAKQIHISLSDGGGILSDVDIRDEKGASLQKQLSANATRSTGGRTFFFSPDAYLEIALRKATKTVEVRYVWTPLPNESLGALKDLIEGGNGNGKRNRRNLS